MYQCRVLLYIQHSLYRSQDSIIDLVFSLILLTFLNILMSLTFELYWILIGFCSYKTLYVNGNEKCEASLVTLKIFSTIFLYLNLEEQKNLISIETTKKQVLNLANCAEWISNRNALANCVFFLGTRFECMYVIFALNVLFFLFHTDWLTVWVCFLLWLPLRPFFLFISIQSWYECKD